MAKKCQFRKKNSVNCGADPQSRKSLKLYPAAPVIVSPGLVRKLTPTKYWSGNGCADFCA